MKTLLILASAICFFGSIFAGAMAIGVGIHDWAVLGVDAKLAAWEAFKIWIGCSLLIIPAAVLATIADYID